jgi:acylphosphatase
MDRDGSSDATSPSSESKTVRVRVFVEGRVQGVWFRGGTYGEAERLGIRGWVRNLPNGCVEAVYEGPRNAVEEMLAWTRRGPACARVDALHIVDETPRGETGFSVL